MNANVVTRREIGWLAADVVTGGDDTNKKNLLAELEHARKADTVPSRDFNHVQIVGERVVKSSKSSKLLAEMYFYSRIPKTISGLFPQLYSTNFFPETSTYSFTMEKLQGVSFSHMLTARSLTDRRLQTMLNALHRIHACDEAAIDAPSGALSPDIKNILAQNSQLASIGKQRSELPVFSKDYGDI